jgi:predicted ATPase
MWSAFPLTFAMAKKPHETRLPAPYLKRLTVMAGKLPATPDYPFNLPWLDEDFEFRFEAPVTIIAGENGTGKSTFIEALAALSGYDEAGGGKGYRPVDHSNALDTSGADLAEAFRAAWLPKITNGWFFRAETFFSVARYQDDLALKYGGEAPDFLSHSHGEGFLRFFDERLGRQGIYFFDEPESALSPRRQLELLKLLAEIQTSERAQVIMATHSPILMAVPGADLVQISKDGFRRRTLQEIPHFRLYKAFSADPDAFVASALAGEEDLLF